MRVTMFYDLMRKNDEKRRKTDEKRSKNWILTIFGHLSEPGGGGTNLSSDKSS